MSQPEEKEEHCVFEEAVEFLSPMFPIIGREALAEGTDRIWILSNEDYCDLATYISEDLGKCGERPNYVVMAESMASWWKAKAERLKCVDFRGIVLSARQSEILLDPEKGMAALKQDARARGLDIFYALQSEAFTEQVKAQYLEVPFTPIDISDLP